MRHPARARRAAILLAVAVALLALHGLRLAASDETDRFAFQSWFTLLADAQFERASADVVDCSSLVRHAYREALRPHTPAWWREYGMPMTVALPDVRGAAPVKDGAQMLFRIAAHPDRFAEFADADTLVRFNTAFVSRDAALAQPGDLLYFRQDAASSPAHLMVFVGPSRFDPNGRDWIVYHTGPDGSHTGEVRKVALSELLKHPVPRWRPIAANPAFVGVFRWLRLSGEKP